MESQKINNKFYQYIYEDYDKLCLAIQECCEENNIEFKLQYEQFEIKDNHPAGVYRVIIAT